MKAHKSDHLCSPRSEFSQFTQSSASIFLMCSPLAHVQINQGAHSLQDESHQYMFPRRPISNMQKCRARSPIPFLMLIAHFKGLLTAVLSSTDNIKCTKLQGWKGSSS